MVKLELEISDLDYNALIETCLPLIQDQLRQTNNPVGLLLSGGMPASMVKTLLNQLTQQQKEQLTADAINSNSAQIIQKIEDAAAQKDIRVRVSKFTASTQQES